MSESTDPPAGDEPAGRRELMNVRSWKSAPAVFTYVITASVAGHDTPVTAEVPARSYAAARRAFRKEHPGATITATRLVPRSRYIPIPETDEPTEGDPK